MAGGEAPSAARPRGSGRDDEKRKRMRMGNGEGTAEDGNICMSSAVVKDSFRSNPAKLLELGPSALLAGNNLSPCFHSPPPPLHLHCRHAGRFARAVRHVLHVMHYRPWDHTFGMPCFIVFVAL